MTGWLLFGICFAVGLLMGGMWAWYSTRTQIGYGRITKQGRPAVVENQPEHVYLGVTKDRYGQDCVAWATLTEEQAIETVTHFRRGKSGLGDAKVVRCRLVEPTDMEFVSPAQPARLKEIS